MAEEKRELMLAALGASFEMCQRCGGTGYVWAPEWEAFHARISDMAEETGHRLSDVWAEHVGEQPDGAEEVECPDCDGEGRTLTPFGKELLARLLVVPWREVLSAMSKDAHPGEQNPFTR
jgi:hypothetical protein